MLMVFLEVAVPRCSEVHECRVGCRRHSPGTVAAPRALGSGSCSVTLQVRARSHSAGWTRRVQRRFCGRTECRDWRKVKNSGKCDTLLMLQPSATMELPCGAAACPKQTCSWLRFPRFGICNINNFVSKEGMILWTVAQPPTFGLGEIHNKSRKH